MESYHLSLKNCRDDLIIKTGTAYRTKRLSRSPQGGAIKDGLDVSISSGYVEFSAA
jgi:hypothetical protein